MLLKYLKILSFLFLFTQSLNADYLYGKNDKCVNDFYFESGTFYYHYSKDDNDTWHRTTTNNYYKYLYPGFIYDSDKDNCYIPEQAIYLGLSAENYRYLLSFSGLLIGFLFLFFGVYIVILVSKK
ncbi:MAG: hypothetical protein QM482_09155 [Sulfurospirillum sp.]